MHEKFGGSGGCGVAFAGSPIRSCSWESFFEGATPAAVIFVPDSLSKFKSVQPCNGVRSVALVRSQNNIFSGIPFSAAKSVIPAPSIRIS